MAARAAIYGAVPLPTCAKIEKRVQTCVALFFDGLLRVILPRALQLCGNSAATIDCIANGRQVPDYFSGFSLGFDSNGTPPSDPRPSNPTLE
jgi:hypothetical protein